MTTLNETQFTTAIKRAFDGGSKRKGKNGKKYVEFVDASRTYLMRVPQKGEIQNLTKRIETQTEPHKKVMFKWKFETGARLDMARLNELITILKRSGETEVELFMSKVDYPIAMCGINTGMEFLLAPRIDGDQPTDPKKVLK
jgi:hypothetical protein